MVDFRDHEVPVQNLLLDPNNYRFHDDPGFSRANDRRYHEDTVQARAYQRLSDDSLVQLKNSILRNGFLPVERIVVRDYPHQDASFVVVEGNRRVAALKWIQQDHAAGVTVPDRVLHTIENVPVLVVDAADDDPAFFESLMGIRHVSGIKEWGGYQRAKLVAVLRGERGLDSSDIGERLAMSTQEVNRRYRAFKALEQMQRDETYGSYVRPDMYALFHEAVSLPLVRDWLGWDDSETTFANQDTLVGFYGLITPGESEDGDTIEPKITTFRQVRDLKDVLPSTDAKTILLDPSRTFLDAITIARRDELTRSWRSSVASVISALGSIPVSEVRHMSPEDITEIERLRAAAAELLDSHRRLQS